MKDHKGLPVRVRRFLALLLAVTMVAGTLPPSVARAAEMSVAGGEDVSVVSSVSSGDITSGDVAEEEQTAETTADAAHEIMDEGGAASVSKAEIVIDDEALAAGINAYGYAFDYTTVTAEAFYQKENPKYAEKVESALQDAVSVYVGGVRNAALKGSLKFTWQEQEEDGSYKNIAEGTKPQNAGLYQVIVSLDAVDGVCAAADPVNAVGLKVKKAVLSITNEQVYFNPGVTAAEVKKANDGIEFYLNQYDVVSRADYVQSMTLQVREAYKDGEGKNRTLEDTEVLQGNHDYYLVAEMVLKDADNYELEQDSLYIYLDGETNTRIDVSYTTEGKVIGKRFDAEPIDFETVVKPEYTARVLYEQDGQEKELADAQIDGAWCDAGQKEYADAGFVPVDAGVYYYKLSYTDTTGTYAHAEAFIRVEIEMVDIVIRPGLDDSVKVYEGMTAEALLKAVKYDVYRVTDGVVSAEPEIVDEYYWGVAYNEDIDTNQYFEPVFAVERGEADAEGNIEWTELESWEEIERQREDTVINAEGVEEQKTVTYSYRIVFTGDKAIYDAYGNAVITRDINASQKNYTVDTTEEARAKNAKTLDEVLASTEVQINVDAILQEGKGKDFDNPIVMVYSGENLYATRDQYKKAVVNAKTETGKFENPIAENTDDRLSYVWEKASWWTSGEQDENGQEIVNWEWDDLGSFNNNVESYCTPYSAGVYRLKIAFADPTGANRSANAYVYYVIKPRDAVMVLSGAPAIYADGVNTVANLLASIQNVDSGETEDSLPGAKDTYVDIAFYPVELSEDAQGKAVVTKDMENPITGISKLRFFRNPSSYFYVERKLTEGENAGAWVKCGRNEVLAAGTDYRLNISYNPANYNFGRKLDIHNLVLVDDYYENETIPVTLKKTEAKEVVISVDESKITDNVKVYDGTCFDLTALKSLVKVKTVEGDIDVTDKVELTYLFYDKAERMYVPVEYAVHGGEYEVSIYTETDAVYREASLTLNTPYEIEKRRLTVEPVFQDSVKAGVRIHPYGYYDDNAFARYILNSYRYYETDTVAEGDDAIENIAKICDWGVYENTSAELFDGYLRSSQTYYAKANGAVFNSRIDQNYGDYISYDRDYDIFCDYAVFTPVRAAGNVGEYYDETRKTALNDEVSQDQDGVFSHTITAKEGVPYIKNITLDGVNREGNFFLFNLYRPGEFNNERSDFTDNGFVYRNAIENEGGYVYDSGYDYITVAFDVSKGGKPGFTVLWEKDYEEIYTVDLDSMIPEADLTKAVEPKSLAFNGVVSKMVAGESQQLDVKVTKAQMGDTILLGYKSYDEDVLTVSESGYVTALMPSKTAVEVEVYPCVMVDGVKTRIDSKTAKKVKITVTGVTAPKISKVTAGDKYAAVTYTKPANGYRREIYVLEGKKIERDFLSAIDGVRNGDYSAFVYTAFITDEETDKKGVTKQWVGNLTPKQDYTVYVRNVSGLRLLEDGRQVAASAAGTLKSVKAIPAQAIAIDAYFDQSERGQTAHYVSGEGYYTAKLEDKSAKLSVRAKFEEMYSKGYSDEEDYIWRTLPLVSDAKKNYTAPKLAYYVSVDRYNQDNEAGTRIYANGYYYDRTASIASVDKKGKVTFKGQGVVYVLAVDSNTGIASAPVELVITATPVSMSGKAIKLLPGETIWLSNYLEYKEKKGKIADYQYAFADLDTTTQSNEYFEIQRYVDSYGYHDIRITALKPGDKQGGKLDIEVTDSAVTKNGGNAARVKLSVLAVEGVKSLKAKEVYDDHFTVTFAYPKIDYDLRFELTDASGKRVITNAIKRFDGSDNNVVWDPKAKKYIYTVTFGDSAKYNVDIDTGSAINPLSNYNLKVTALWENYNSKEAKLKVKTINIPASYQKLSEKRYGGSRIRVSGGSNGTHYLDGVVLKTGNTYTLDMPLTGTLDNSVARIRMTDTLIWKSTNTRVASVKANTGSYSAKLKTLKQGETTIEVSSKLTKNVIARYKVNVEAVGAAGSAYFGENEPYGVNDIVNVPVNDKDCLEVTMNSNISVTLKPGEAQWFVFTAPAYGEYTITNYGYYATYYDESGSSLGSGYERTGTWQKNQKVYVYCVCNSQYTRTWTVGVSGSFYKTAALGETRVRNGQSVVFTAPEDNYYTITYVYGDKEFTADSRSLEKGQEMTHYVDWSGMDGKEFGLVVTRREPQKLALTAEGKEIKLEDSKEHWYAFTADAENYYTFSSTGATATVQMEQFDSLKDSSGTYWWGVDADKYKSIALDKGQTIYLKVTADSASKDSPVKFTLKIVKARVVESVLKTGSEGGKLTFTGPEKKWCSFTAPESAYYSISAKSKETLEMAWLTSLKEEDAVDYAWFDDGPDADGASTYKFDSHYIEKGDTVYLCVEPEPGACTEQNPLEVTLTAEKRPTMAGEETQTFTVNAHESKTIYYRIGADYWQYTFFLSTSEVNENLSWSVEGDEGTFGQNTSGTAAYYNFDYEENDVMIVLTNDGDKSAEVEVKVRRLS